MSHIPFQIIDRNIVDASEHKGETGLATWRTIQFTGLRIRRVDYSAGYMADHWCRKGHVVHCLEGAFTSELDNGESFLLTKGMTYVVSDDLSTHRSHTADGVSLLIIDGDFLKPCSIGIQFTDLQNIPAPCAVQQFNSYLTDESKS